MPPKSKQILLIGVICAVVGFIAGRSPYIYISQESCILHNIDKAHSERAATMIYRACEAKTK